MCLYGWNCENINTFFMSVKINNFGLVWENFQQNIPFNPMKDPYIHSQETKEMTLFNILCLMAPYNYNA